MARRLLPALAAATGRWADVAVSDCASQIGSGSLPVDALPSAAIALTPKAKRKGAAAEAFASAFRALPRPVIGRIKDGAFILDLRCLDDEDAFVKQLGQLDLSALRL